MERSGGEGTPQSGSAESWRRNEGGRGEGRDEGYQPPVCKFWAQGNCTRGNTCQFAHSMEGRRGRRPNRGRGNWSGGVNGEFSNTNGTTTKNTATNTNESRGVEEGQVAKRVCRYWKFGECQKGTECTFLHPSEMWGMSRGRGRRARGRGIHRGRGGRGRGYYNSNYNYHNANTNHHSTESVQGATKGSPHLSTNVDTRSANTNNTTNNNPSNTTSTTPTTTTTSTPTSTSSTSTTSASNNSGGSAATTTTAASSNGSGTGSFTPTVMCKFWQRGNCQKGNACTFLHPPEAKGTHASPYYNGGGGSAGGGGGAGWGRGVGSWGRGGGRGRGRGGYYRGRGGYYSGGYSQSG